jgi:hypothetical protein
MPTEENQQYILNFYRTLLYPGDLPIAHDIGHVKVYEQIHGRLNLNYLYRSNLNQHFQRIHEELCVLYWQLVYNWSDYEDYLDNEKIDNLNKRNFI